MLDQIGARLGLDGEAMLGEQAVDQLAEIAALVAVAGQRRGVAGALDQPPERRARAELAGIDHHQRLERLELQQRAAGRGRLVARLPQPHHAAAAEQAERPGLVEQAAGIAADHVRAELAEAEGVARIVDHGPDQAQHALAHEALIGTVDQHHRRVGPAQEALDLAAAELHEGATGAAGAASCGAGEMDRELGADVGADLARGAALGIELGGELGVGRADRVVARDAAHGRAVEDLAVCCCRAG